ncbi:phospholipid phosphatase 1-like isoform X2 [Amphiura filiformis]|uniref:phospholipid phosphatase 1-like isoform X2 n=1 Tax=Amphiura filiformis TaxID=82378 RepID=UPI003B21C65A
MIMAGSGAAKCGFIVLDALALLLLMIPVAVFRLPGVDLPVFMRGFFCNDQSLMYPYNDSSIPSTVLYSVGIALPLITIILTELVIFTYRKRQDADYLPPDTMNKCCGGMTIPPLLYNLLKYATFFLFGTLITQITFDVANNSVGRLRPHFFSVCQPDWNAANCSDGYLDFYVTDDVCTGTDEHRIYEARRSFPSGHAALSVYFMLFLALYLQKRWTWRDTTYLRPLIQFVTLMLAVYTCFSRISDYKHHWSDVLGGAIIGAIIATGVISMEATDKWFTETKGTYNLNSADLEML